MNTLSCRFVHVSLAALTFAGCSLTSQLNAQLEIFNPDWSITLTDFGYSDLLFDQRPGFVGREYLSGEWGAAVGYDLIDTSSGSVVSSVSPEWLEPEFIFPDWTTNSRFGTVSAIAPTAGPAAAPTAAESTIANPVLEIYHTYEMIPTDGGIDMGYEPKSAGGPGKFKTSTEYVLKQTYKITNKETDFGITNLNLYQFLHGLFSDSATYDDRMYPPGGPFDDYRYDTTNYNLMNMDPLFGNFIFEDFITFHSNDTPVGWEVGRYGVEGIDSHVVGKPGSGVHLSVESGALSGSDGFFPAELWVSGAQQYNLLSLNDLDVLLPGEMVSFDVLLSIHNVTTPEPATNAMIVIAAVAALVLWQRRRNA